MKSGDRDLLILLNESKYSRKEIEKEAFLINNLLLHVETSAYRTRVIEVIDIHRHRISCSPKIIDGIFLSNSLRSFQFIFHKN